jgi:hypothetical protein
MSQPSPVARALLVVLAGSALAAAAFGCGSEVRFVAPPQAMLAGGVSVTFQRAETEDEALEVRLWMMNLTDQMMIVNRDGFALRLPTGQILQREGERHEPYLIPPGAGRNVTVRFEAKGFEASKLPSASVIIGGISYQNDPMPRVVGEIPLTAAGPAE